MLARLKASSLTRQATQPIPLEQVNTALLIPSSAALACNRNIAAQLCMLKLVPDLLRCTDQDSYTSIPCLEY